jgi:hypothetical protein
MAYTEKVLEEKEQMLRKYIQDNYSKIQNVERELASLAMEVKLTAGPKKAGLNFCAKFLDSVIVWSSSVCMSCPGRRSMSDHEVSAQRYILFWALLHSRCLPNDVQQ